jgi:hypothetical protein
MLTVLRRACQEYGFLARAAIRWKRYESLSSFLSCAAQKIELTEALAPCTPPSVPVFNTVLNL